MTALGLTVAALIVWGGLAWLVDRFHDPGEATPPLFEDSL